MDAGGAGELGQAADLALDLERGGHHQVGELVDDDDPEGHAFGDLGVLVVGLDVAHGEGGEALVAGLHLLDHGAESADHLLHVDDDVGEGEVRDHGEAGELDPLGVDHDEAHFFGFGVHEDAGDDRVDADALAGSRWRRR